MRAARQRRKRTLECHNVIPKRSSIAVESTLRKQPRLVICIFLDMAPDPVALMYADLEWLRQSKEQWKLAYQDAERQGKPVIAETCGAQIAAFDHLIKRAEEFLRRHGERRLAGSSPRDVRQLDGKGR